MGIVDGRGRARRARMGLIALPILVAASVAVALTAGSAGAARAAAASAATTAPPPLTWSSPVPLEQAPYQQANELASISCPSARFCITETALPGTVGVLTSTDPAGGPLAWSAPRVAFKQYIGSLSGPLDCPTSDFCAQLTDHGIYASTAPASGRLWSRSTADNSLFELSCPSSRLCVGAAGHGFLTSTDPGARHASWHSAAKYGVGLIEEVSCPAAWFCAAVTTDGYLLTSSHPASGASAWKATHIDGSSSLFSLSCPSDKFCLAQDNAGRFLYSTDPVGGASRWHAAARPSFPLTQLTCTSATFCAAVDPPGDVAWTTDPTAGPSAWSQVGISIEQYSPGTLSCASASFCAVSGSAGDVVTSSDPASSAPTWTTADIDGYTNIDDVECPAVSLCLAADADGHLFTSADPTGGTRAWKAADVPATSITCPTTTFCAALAGTDLEVTDDVGLEISDDPNGGTSAWQSVTAPAGLLTLSCPSPSLCVAFGTDSSEDTLVYTSTDPSGGASTWQAANLGRTGGSGSLSCPTVSLCVGTVDGYVLTSTDPTGGAAAWQFISLAPLGLGAAGLSCPSSSLCMGLASSEDPDDPANYVLHSADPAGGSAAWHVSGGGGSGDVLLDCPSAAECYQFSGVEGATGIATSTDPTAASPSWLPSTSTAKLLSVSCPTVSLCVGGFYGGYRGGIQVATPPHPGATLDRLKVSLTRLTYGHETREHLTATVGPLYPQYTAVPAGRIVIASRNQTLCRLTLKHGRASCTLTRDQLTPGSYWLRIRYAGDRAYAASQSATIKVTVVR